MAPDPTRIINLANAFYDSNVLFAASDLGIFGALAEFGKAGPKLISQRLGLSERGTVLLLDACVSLGLLIKENDIYFNSPETATFLVPGFTGDLSGAIRYNRDVYGAWGKLAEFVKTGKPVEKPEVHLGEDEKRTRTFVLSMHGRAMGIGRAVLPNLDFSGCKKVFDVGGGPGTYSVLIARTNPEVTCTVLDLPEVVKIAAELIEKQGMSERVKTVPGDYRSAEFPAGNDAVLFFGMMHQESPDSIRSLLARAYESLNHGGKIFVMDMMTDASHTAPKFSALFAVNMALTTENGWVFSDEELNAWVTEAGFANFKVKPLAQPMPHWIATATKS